MSNSSFPSSQVERVSHERLPFNLSDFSIDEGFKLSEIKVQERNYWKTKSDDNSRELQSIVDVCFNQKDSINVLERTLEVAYQNNQSGTNLIILCWRCKVELSSFDTLHSHVKGKSHLKAVNRYFTKEEVNPNITNGLHFKDPFEPTNAFERDTLECNLDHYNGPVIGCSMMFAEKYDGEKYFSCYICMQLPGRHRKYYRMDKHLAFEHITSVEHQEHYINVKDFKTRQKYLTEKLNFDGLVKYVAQKEGKLVSRITCLSKTDIENEMRHSKKRRVASPPRASSSSSWKPPPPAVKKNNTYYGGKGVDIPSGMKYNPNNANMVPLGPRTPPSPSIATSQNRLLPSTSKATSSTQYEYMPETLEEFTRSLMKIKKHSNPEERERTHMLYEKFIKDQDAFNLICRFCIVLASMLHTYSKRLADQNIEDITRKITQKCTFLDNLQPYVEDID